MIQRNGNLKGKKNPGEKCEFEEMTIDRSFNNDCVVLHLDVVDSRETTCHHSARLPGKLSLFYALGIFCWWIYPKNLGWGNKASLKGPQLIGQEKEVKGKGLLRSWWLHGHIRGVTRVWVCLPLFLSKRFDHLPSPSLHLWDFLMGSHETLNDLLPRLACLLFMVNLGHLDVATS